MDPGFNVAATCLDRSVVETGLRNLGASWNPQVPGAFARALERLLVHAELDGTASPTATDVCFTGAAQAAADLLVEASRRSPVRFGSFGDAEPSNPPPPPPSQVAVPLTGLTGWAALGAAVVLAGVTLGPPAVKAFKKKRRRRKT